MCDTCGCQPSHDHNQHSHDHDEQSIHEKESLKIDLSQNILETNNLYANRIKGFFEARSIVSLNIMSSPGSGKTTILERTISKLKEKSMLYVIEGDQQTQNDADRIRRLGIKAEQINTGNGCHLDAHSVYKSVKDLDPQQGSIVFIENVGNLICPAIFFLGENKKVVIISVTEGEDKPLKYPQIFYECEICIINKIDLLPYLHFDIQMLRNNILAINPKIKIIEMSAYNDENIEDWCNYLLKLKNEIYPSENNYFDEKASSWDEKQRINADKIREMLNKMNISQNDTFLDAGTGTGILIPYIREKCFGNILAVDNSEKMLELAQKKFSNYDNIFFSKLNIETDHIAGRFDKIIMFCVFPHLNNRLLTVKKLIENNLKPGGILLICHDKGRKFLNEMHHHKHDSRIMHSRLIDVEAQKEIFTNNGLNVTEAYENDNFYLIMLQK
ncbi:MAG: hydrogenase nickel incorporation protein HypB [Bacteroidales bacterium]|nr:hydrogenase nickel incorporation protein HypB [Bacteroidales bacterium]